MYTGVVSDRHVSCFSQVRIRNKKVKPKQWHCLIGLLDIDYLKYLPFSSVSFHIPAGYAHGTQLLVRERNLSFEVKGSKHTRDEKDVF